MGRLVSNQQVGQVRLLEVNSRTWYWMRCLSRKAVTADQNSSDIVMFLRCGYETGSSVLQSLESSEKMVGNPVQQAVALSIRDVKYV